MSLKTTDLYVFGPYRLDPAERLLLCDGQPVGLPPKAFDLLVALVVRAGHLVTKDDLLREVWPGTFVEEANLSYTISLLRKALGDNSERYIETVPKRGYRFRHIVSIPAAPALPRLSLRRGSIWAAAASAAALVALAVAMGVGRGRAGSGERGDAPIVAVPITAYVGWALAPSISPDGTRVAFSWGLRALGSNPDIYVKPLGGGWIDFGLAHERSPQDPRRGFLVR